MDNTVQVSWSWMNTWMRSQSFIYIYIYTRLYKRFLKDVGFLMTPASKIKKEGLPARRKEKTFSGSPHDGCNSNPECAMRGRSGNDALIIDSPNLRWKASHGKVWISKNGIFDHLNKMEQDATNNILIARSRSNSKPTASSPWKCLWWTSPWCTWSFCKMMSLVAKQSATAQSYDFDHRGQLIFVGSVGIFRSWWPLPSHGFWMLRQENDLQKYSKDGEVHP